MTKGLTTYEYVTGHTSKPLKQVYELDSQSFNLSSRKSEGVEIQAITETRKGATDRIDKSPDLSIDGPYSVRLIRQINLFAKEDDAIV